MVTVSVCQRRCVSAAMRMVASLPTERHNPLKAMMMEKQNALQGLRDSLSYSAFREHSERFLGVVRKASYSLYRSGLVEPSEWAAALSSCAKFKDSSMAKALFGVMEEEDRKPARDEGPLCEAIGSEGSSRDAVDIGADLTTPEAHVAFMKALSPRECLEHFCSKFVAPYVVPLERHSEAPAVTIRDVLCTDQTLTKFLLTLMSRERIAEGWGVVLGALMQMGREADCSTVLQRLLYDNSAFARRVVSDAADSPQKRVDQANLLLSSVLRRCVKCGNIQMITRVCVLLYGANIDPDPFVLDTLAASLNRIAIHSSVAPATEREQQQLPQADPALGMYVALRSTVRSEELRIGMARVFLQWAAQRNAAKVVSPVFAQMRAEQLVPTPVCYTSGIEACARDDPQCALGLYSTLR